MIKEAISTVSIGKNLTFSESQTVMDEIMSGKALPSQIGAFLTALHVKGESTEEISGCAKSMRDKSTKVEHEYDVIDIVGTGGDCAGSINISTISAIITAAAGGHVAKHGNRAASSKCGTADCLEALGVNISLEPEKNIKIMNETGICFLFAQKYHTAMKYVASVRREIGIPTVFNLLGPLCNPARAELQLLGVYSESLLRPMTEALKSLGIKRAMTVYGKDKLDEISISDSTAVCELNDGIITEYEITPEQFGLKRYEKNALKGGTPEENAQAALRILKGEKGAGRDAVILNAGAAIHIINGIDISEGIAIAAEAIDSGKAMKTLERFIEFSNE